MRLYLDTEFNGFGGELMSIGIAPSDPQAMSFYAVVKWEAPTDPWVQEHVVPHLGFAPMPRREAAVHLAQYLTRFDGHAIVADWPTDFEHLLALLITGPGQMLIVPDFDMEYRRMPGFSTASASKVPHNALADAEALRDYWEAQIAP